MFIKAYNIYYIVLVKHRFLLVVLLSGSILNMNSQNCYSYITPISSASSTTECLAKSKTAVYYGGTFNANINLSGIDLLYVGGVGSDVFLAKTNNYGQIIWAESWGSNRIDGITAISVHENIVYAAGYFKDTLIIENDTLFNNGQTAAFIVTYDTLGNYINSFSPNAYNMRISDMEIDSDGKLLLSGDYYQYLNIDNNSFTSLNGFNYFLMKYDYWTNQLDWFKESNGNNTEGKGIAQDSLGNIYVCGLYGLNAIIEGNLLPNSNGNHNTFIAKYTDTGVFEWITTIEGNGEVHGYGIDVTPSGQVFVTGEFENLINFPNSSSLLSEGLYDVFVSSYDSLGNILWIKSYGGFDNDIGRSLQIDYNEDPIVLSDAGGGFSINSTLVTPNGNNEPLLVKLKKTDGELINHYRVKSTNASGVVQSKQFVVLDTTIFVGGKNFSSIWCGSNEYNAQNINDSYLITISDSLTYELSTTILKQSIIDEFVIFPNPATNYLTIKFSKEERHNIKLINGLGQLELEENTTDKDVILDLLKINNSGIYLLIIDNDTPSAKKIILTK